MRADWLILLLSVLPISVHPLPQPTRSLYPLQISAGRRYLTDQQQSPFLYHADTGWQLLHRLTTAQAGQYLQNRHDKGFNTIQVQLLPVSPQGTNQDGQGPFLAQCDFATPNEAYFAHVDAIIRMAGAKNMQFALNPAWLADWGEQYTRNGTEKCRAYGRYLGRRYRDFDSILWLMGGDVHPGKWMAEIRAMAEGIREFDTRHLMTAHAETPSSALDRYAGESWLDINTTYTYSPDRVYGPYHVYVKALGDYNRAPVMPFVLVESFYEGEHGATPQWVRRQAYWALLSGACGQAMGNHPIYAFAPGWQHALDAPGSQSMAHLKRLMDTLPWTDFVPDQEHKLLTAGYGTYNATSEKTGYDYAATACARNGSAAMIYLPTSRAIHVNLRVLSGSRVRAWWFNPRNGRMVNQNNGLSNKPFAEWSHKTECVLTPPSAAAEDDWVLVLRGG